jgi:hypothetical protein
MSIPFGSNVLTFSDVAKQLRTTFETLTDRRRGKNTRYTLVNAALSAFSVFFMQSLSFLGHQRTMQDKQGKDNAQTPFGVHQAPTDNHIRSSLDAVDPAATSCSPMGCIRCRSGSKVAGKFLRRWIVKSMSTTLDLKVLVYRVNFWSGNVESTLHQAGRRLALGLTAGAAGLAHRPHGP